MKRQSGPSGQPGPWAKPSDHIKDLSLGALFFLGTVLLTGCAHTDSAASAGPSVTVPGQFTIYPENAPAPDRWWEGFGSAELDTLVDDTLAGSLTLRQSLARLEQSRSLVIQAGADRLPDLTLNAGASETRRETGGQRSETSSRSLALASSWELDFWGRVRATERAALLDQEGSRESLYSAAMTLVSEVTLKWLEMISVKRQMELVRTQLETNRTILDLMEQRYLKGLANALDVYQQRQAVAETEASLPQLEAREETLLNEIAVLSGRPPRTDLKLTAAVFPGTGPLPTTGVPADLLARRPDIRTAGLKLRATKARTAAARSGRLPKVTLSATAGYSSNSLADILDDWLGTLAANLAWTLFDSGSKRAEVTRLEAVAGEYLAAYEQAVLTAIREVEDAMVREVRQAEYVKALEEQLSISRDGFREAISRYRKGLSDYLPVLTALTGTQRLERSIVLAEFERLSQRVTLHRALGGGWMEEEFE
ncbi:MAG: efflux transporter outer membrane subunit [bacterium]|nr:efflux transporter outer membrane subunit [bacterium]